MAVWTNRTAGVGARNGTTSHTITFASDGDAPFTPTDGRLLVVVAAGSVTMTWPGGWNERLSPTNNTELSVATITASSTTSVTITHNGSNYPIAYVVYEFPAGTTWVTGASAANQAVGAAQPTVTLPGAPVEVFYAASHSIATTGGTTESATWPATATENVDSFTDDNGVTDGIWLGVAYKSGLADFSATVTPTITAGSGAGSGTERVTFALALTPLVTVLEGSSTALTMSVQVAWGADLTAASTTWTWTDITADVLVDGGEQITYSLGRQDEAATSQSASCTLRLDNRTGAYSLGPQASNWPYVRRNTPLRIRVGGDATGTPFFGYVDSWQPDFDQSGRYAVVNVSASGTIRRLQQGRQSVLSSIRRAMRQEIDGNLIAYWPMEDSKDALYCSSDIPGHPPLTVDDVFGVQPKFADAAPFACSDKLPNLNYSWLGGGIPAYTDTGELQFRALVEFPANGMNDGVSLMSIEMDLSTTTAQIWTLAYRVGGALSLDATDVDGGTLGDTGDITFDVDGLRLRVAVSLVQVGANIDYSISTLSAGDRNALEFTGTFAGITLGRVIGADLQRGFTAGEPVIGHFMVQNEATSPFSEYDEFGAWTGEGALDRIVRLCSESRIYGCTVYSDGRSGPLMGPQSVTDVLSLLRECETADQGIVYDGELQGLSYMAHNQIVNLAAPILTLDVSAGRVRSIETVDDDQALRNRITVSRSGGGAITVEDLDGPLGTATVGVYDDSVTLNCASDLQLPDYAGWLINLGTVEGYRYPRAEVHLRDLTTALIGALFVTLPMRRIDITNLSTARTQLPTGARVAVPTGWEGAFDKHQWQVVYNCAPYDGYNVVLLDESDDVHGLRANTAGSTLASAAAAGATSLSVATTTGPLWTTAAGDMPMTVEVGDLPVTVSAISGGSSPQTFTVSATTLALAAGVSVTVPRSRPILDIEDDS